MATDIYIYSEQYSQALEEEGRGGLEDDLEEFLGAAGGVTGGGGGGRGWNVDLEVRQDVEVWIGRLCEFLRGWGVPGDTYFHVFPPDWVPGTEPRRVRVFPASGPEQPSV